MPLSKFFCTNAGLAPKRARRKEARPGELLEAALDLFVEKGFAGTRMEEVAARAGVSKGTVFLYFASKEELFKAVVRHNISGRFTEWNAEFESFEGNSADMLRYCMQTWWERVGATQASGISKLMISEGRNFPEIAEFYQREVIEPGHQLIRRVLQRGIDRGELRAMDLNYVAYGLMASMMFLILSKHSIVMSLKEDMTLDPLTYIACQADIFLRGLGAEPTAPHTDTGTDA
jgi:AcrR family transcriptional regulator